MIKVVDKDRGDYASIREKRIMVESFNQYVSRELNKNKVALKKNP